MDTGRMFSELKEHKELSFALEMDKKIGSKLKESEFTKNEIVLLQATHCLINKPSVILIESEVIENASADVKSMLKKMATTASNSIIISFDKSGSQIIKSDKTYSLKNGKIDEK